MSNTLSSPLYLEMYGDSHAELSTLLFSQRKHSESKICCFHALVSSRNINGCISNFTFIDSFEYIIENPNIESHNIKSLKFNGVEIFVESLNIDYDNKLVIVTSIPGTVISLNLK